MPSGEQAWRPEVKPKRIVLSKWKLMPAMILRLN
jgi:hypothetical protein